MNLRKYFELNGMTKLFFAKKIGTTAPQVSRWCSGNTLPSLEFAVKIEDETKGAVKCRDWIDDPM